MNLVQAQLRAGTASRVDLATAQVPVAQARVALVRAARNGADGACGVCRRRSGLQADTLSRTGQRGERKFTEHAGPVLSYDQAVKRALFAAAGLSRCAEHGAVGAVQRAIAAFGTASDAYRQRFVRHELDDCHGTDFRPSSTVGANAEHSDLRSGRNARADGAGASATRFGAGISSQQTRLTVETDVRPAFVGLVTAQARSRRPTPELSQAQTVLRPRKRSTEPVSRRCRCCSTPKSA